MIGRLVVVALALVAIGCGAARDGRFRGTAVLRVTGFFGAGDGPYLLGSDRSASIAAMVEWGVPGDAPFVTTQLALDLTHYPVFELELLANPPLETLRDPDTLAATAQRDNAIAVGQLVFFADFDADGDYSEDEPILGWNESLIVWSPEGASGGALIRELPAGFRMARPSAPCDVRPLRLSPNPNPGYGPFIGLDQDIDPDMRFFDPACVDAVTASEPRRCVVRRLVGARWVCRAGEAPAEMCAQCEYQLYPEGASAATCEAWHARCLSRRTADQEFDVECAAELDFCLSDVARAEPCDLACACGKLADWCAENGPIRSACVDDLPGCRWTD